MTVINGVIYMHSLMIAKESELTKHYTGDASDSRELGICNCVSQDFSAFPGNTKFQNAVEMTCPLLCQIPGIWNAEIYTNFGISNAIFDQKQLQMTATLCIHQSSQNATNLPDSKWNADDRFSNIGCVSNF